MKRILLFLILLIPINVIAKTEAVIDITNLNIIEIQEYVDKGYLTYEQITNIYLDRIEAYNEQYNAIITVNEKALEQAKQLDNEYKKNGKKSLLHGIPILVKDNIDVVGMPTTNGTKALLDSYPYKNATIIQKLIDAGAIIIAKTNMDEFAFNAAYSHSSFGYVYNSYNTKYSSYGSSGGTAVGVSSGLAVAGIGTDTGSSIRIPSAANNLVGLRPTWDIIANDGIIKFESLRDVAGPITKYTIDNAIILDIIDNKEINYIENINNDLTGIKIGVFKSILNNSSSFIKELMNNQIENLKQLGAEIIYVDTIYPTYKFDATTMCYEFNEYIKNTSSKIKSLDDLIKNGNYTQWIDSYNNMYCYTDYKNTSSYKNYLQTRKNNIKFVNNKFESYDVDVVIYPTLQTKLLKMSEIYTTKLKTNSSNLAPLVGFPSINIPIGFNDNLPYGMEIVSQANNETILYKISKKLEKINNFYKLPEISPNLYEISDNIKILLDYYEKEETNKKYEEVKKEIKTFIDNYNNEENKEEKINELILKYENTPELIIEEEKENKKNTVIIIIIVIITIILIFKKILKKKVK